MIDLHDARCYCCGALVICEDPDCSGVAPHEAVCEDCLAAQHRSSRPSTGATDAFPD
jgi:hypothetical protein